MFSESSEHLSDMFPVGLQVFGKDKDVIKVDKDRDIQHVTKDAVDNALEGCRSIGQTFRDHHPFIGAIAGAKCSLPLVAFSNAYQVVGGTKV